MENIIHSSQLHVHNAVYNLISINTELNQIHLLYFHYILIHFHFIWFGFVCNNRAAAILYRLDMEMQSELVLLKAEYTPPASAHNNTQTSFASATVWWSAGQLNAIMAFVWSDVMMVILALEWEMLVLAGRGLRPLSVEHILMGLPAVPVPPRPCPRFEIEVIRTSTLEPANALVEKHQKMQ